MGNVGMELPWSWLLVASLLAICVVTTWLVVRAVRQIQAQQWQLIHGYYSGTTYLAPRWWDNGRLVRCLQEAETCLIQHTSWGAANMALVGHSVHVLVQKGAASCHGRRLATGYFLVVQPNLAGLCHEMAHLAEYVLEGKVRETHKHWGVDGVWTAVAQYEDWLRSGDTRGG